MADVYRLKSLRQVLTWSAKSCELMSACQRLTRPQCTPQSRPDSNPQPTPGSASSGAHDLEAIQAYPTDSKVREKEKKARLKAQGITIEVKKQKKFVEAHYDDCGANLDSLDLYANPDTDEELEDQATTFAMIMGNPWI